MVPHAERPQFHSPLLKRTRCQHTSLMENLWMKAKDEGALTPACIVQKNPQVPQTFRQVACHPVNNSKGKRRSIPQQKTRCDSLVPTLQGPWDPSQKRRGSLRFLRPLEMRPFSIAPHSVESREPLTNSTVSLSSQSHNGKLPEVTGTSRGNPGFSAVTRERPRECFKMC